MEAIKITESLEVLEILDIKQANRKWQKLHHPLHKLMNFLLEMIKCLGIVALVYCILHVIYQPSLLTFESIAIMLQSVIIAHFFCMMTGYYSNDLKSLKNNKQQLAGREEQNEGKNQRLSYLKKFIKITVFGVGLYSVVFLAVRGMDLGVNSQGYHYIIYDIWLVNLLIILKLFTLFVLIGVIDALGKFIAMLIDYRNQKLRFTGFISLYQMNKSTRRMRSERCPQTNQIQHFIIADVDEHGELTYDPTQFKLKKKLNL